MGPQNEEIIELYLQYGRAGIEHQSRADFASAFEAVCQIVARGKADDAIELVRALIERAGDDNQLLDFIAAGPLEDLLSYQGPASIGPILSAAEGDERLRGALYGVWGENRMEPQVLARLQEARDRWGGR
jgi:hypothetical protein